MVIRAGYAPSTGGGSGTLVGHKFTSVETFALKDGLSEETIVFVAVDLINLSIGVIDIIQDSVVIQTVQAGTSITRVLNPSLDLDFESRNGGGIWNISTLQTVGNVSFGASSPQDMTFNNDGTIMYSVHGLAGSTDTVRSMTLVTPWLVSSAVALGSIIIGATMGDPKGLFLSPDEKRLYISGDSAGVELQTWTFGTIGDVTTLTHTNTLAWAGDTSASSIHFDPTGTIMYVSGGAGGDIFQFSLSTPWLLTTAIQTQLFDISGTILNPAGMWIKPDGSRMYFCNTGAGGDIEEFVFTIPWDITSLVFVREFDTSGESGLPRGIFMRANGEDLYICDDTGDQCEQYDSSVTVAFTGTAIVSGG